jgi:amino acid adenylation domain-containing protein
VVDEVRSLIEGLEAQGVELWFEGNQLRFRAPQGALPAQARNDLAGRRDAVLASLRQRAGTRVVHAPLSYGQRSLWLVHQDNPASPAYNVAFVVDVRSAINETALRESLQTLVDRHAVLRTTYAVIEGRPTQLIRGDAAAAFDIIRRPGLDDRELHALMDAVYRQPFDLQDGPVLRTTLVSRGEQDHVLMICAHHIAVDGWSLLLLLDELRQLYAGLCAGKAPSLPRPETSYADYTRWQAQMLADASGESLSRYWLEQLKAPRAQVELPGDRARPARKSVRGATCEFSIDRALTERLNQLARAEGSTLFVLMLAAFKVLLFRCSGVEDVIVGTPTLGRGNGRFERTVGHFVNPVPLRSVVQAQLPFRDLLRQVRDTLLEAIEAEAFPLALMVERLQPERDSSRSPLFETIFVLQRFSQFGELGSLLNAGPDDPYTDFGGLQVRPYALNQQEGQFDLGLGLVELGDQLGGAFKYCADLFDSSTVERLTGLYIELLRSIVADPGQPVGRLRMLGEAQCQLLLKQWNATSAPYPVHQTVHGLFEAQVARTPDAVAVRFESESLTYAELNARANRLAHHLRALGAGNGALVGVWMERGPDMVVAVLGILKAGAAYVPLDPAFPKDRIDYMMEDAELRVVVTQSALAGGLPQGVQGVSLDADAATLSASSPLDLVPTSGAGDLAYVIYTSGSTGRPKGVMLEHRSVVNFLLSMHRAPGISASDRFVAVTTLSFDIAGLEIYGPLTVGGTVVLASRATALDGLRLATLLDASEATLLQATPATWRLLLESGWRGRPGLKMLCGGEGLPRDLADKLLATGGELWNMYGPTETTIWSTIDHVTDTSRAISIGRPIANTQVYVLEPSGLPAPIGVGGELCIGGDGLARGYRNRDDLTAEKFVTLDLPGVGSKRVYRTGDVVRWLADGRLEFVGRRDHQVKVRGFRIELGEIETVLAKHQGVKECVVHVREDTPGDQRLVAYVVPQSGTTVETEAMRATLRMQLPEYMVPNLFVVLDVMPLTPNGKVDRKALPAPTANAPSADEDAGEALMNPVQRRVAALWRSVLNLERVGLHANFFDVGGHSLLLVRLQAAIQREFGHELTLVELFQRTTVAEQADRLAAPAGGSAALERAKARVKRNQGPRALGTNPKDDFPSHAIAIVGMAGRFPGARDLDEFWQNLKSGVESLVPFSDGDLDAAGVAPALRCDPNYVRRGTVLEGADMFDAAFFGMSPREAQILDPQQRIFLECAWEALEHAGHAPGTFDQSVGVYGGMSMNSYLISQILRDPALVASVGGYQLMLGNDKDFLCTRVSYKLDLHGPSMAIQTACSTSLVAVHVACQALTRGECDMALAGGVSVSFPQCGGYLFQEGMILSPDGVCRPFDADARGTRPGAGAGLVVLKRLADALADGDTIHAVIRGAAINNDGAGKAGYTAPSADGQVEAIATAQMLAGVDARSIGYIEAHGTGTPLGDPIEIAALTEVFRATTGDVGFCRLGSLKANLGHLDAAAGVAGLIKAVLVLQHQEVPPLVNFTKPNPQLDLAHSPFTASATASDWPSGDQPRRAGVSAFGIGGTNAHVVLEEAPPVAPRSAGRCEQLLVLSASTASALDAATERLALHLERHAEQELRDIAWTVQAGRRAFAHRRVVVASDRLGAITSLREPQHPPVHSGLHEGDVRPVAFLFSGQGSQFVRMGEGLYRDERVFRVAVDRCAELLRPHLGLDLRDVMYPEAGASVGVASINQTDLAQPALFVTEYALACLWQHWGVRPSAMLGHSIGEYVAAHLAGVIALEDVLAIVAARGRLMQALPAGRMAAVHLGSADLGRLIEATDVEIAAANAPGLCTVSGPGDAVTALLERLDAQGVESRVLHTSHAFHSAMMEPVLERFTEVVAGARLQAPSLPYVSNLTGTWITADEACSPAYYARHLRGTVQFESGLRTLAANPALHFLEVGPGNALASLARMSLGKDGGKRVLASLGRADESRPDVPAMLEAAGRLWLAGVPIEWRGLHGETTPRRVPLPTYPFERKRFSVGGSAAHVVSLDKADASQSAGASTPLLREEFEQGLAAIWIELLGVDSVAPADDFFELGGHSLLATRVLTRIEDRFGVHLALRDVFDAPTLGRLADKIASRAGGKPGAGTADDREEMEF